uniref:Uncharacterized protein n=1 Tax=Phytophthora ramorum TaxID=164328 RepID=H3H195_PHYRM
MADDAGRVTYELLRCHGDPDNAQTHKEMLRALSSVRVDRQSAEVLQRLHATEFALLRGEHKDIQVSKRRRELRDKWRLKQSDAATLEDVQRRYPKLFEGVRNLYH